MRMSQMSISTVAEPTVKRGPGRLPRYGKPTVQGTVHYPRELLTRLREEVVWRNARAGNPEDWAVSSLVVDILLDHFGMDKPGADKNGHSA